MADGRTLPWGGCVNARDLGGLGSIKPGAVVRMEASSYLSEAGWAATWEYGVRTPSIYAIREVHAELCAETGEDRDRAGAAGPGRHTVLRTLATDRSPGLTAVLPGDAGPEPMIAAVRAIANAAPGCVAFHCAGVRTGPDFSPSYCSRWPEPHRRRSSSTIC